MEKTFKYVGSSYYKGQWKLRFANDINRSKFLSRTGHEHVYMIRLPEDMTERDGARHLFSDELAMQHAKWRQHEDGCEGTPLLASSEERSWYIEHWMETHPED
jgi:hypothetical protein